MASSEDITAAISHGSQAIDPDQTLKASKALLAHIKKAASQSEVDSKKRNVIDDEDLVGLETPIWLTLTTKRHISKTARLSPGKIPLPHPLHPETAVTSICTITADPQRVYKNIIASKDFPAALGKRITRVIGFSKLKAKYRQYEAQRKLFSEYDIFVADDRIINRLPKVLGKTFYKTTQKRPIPVILQAKKPKVDGKRMKQQLAKASHYDAIDFEAAVATANAAPAAKIAKEIQSALGSALVSLAPTTNTAIRVGYAHWPPEHIAANVNAVATTFIDKWVSQKWRNVKSIYIKGPSTAALPIWQTDELWLDERDVIAVDDEHAEGDNATSERANVGRKRKSIAGSGGADMPALKKNKKPAADKPREADTKPEGDDTSLDKHIAERKAKLKRQKAAVQRTMDD